MQCKGGFLEVKGCHQSDNGKATLPYGNSDGRLYFRFRNTWWTDIEVVRRNLLNVNLQSRTSPFLQLYDPHTIEWHCCSHLGYIKHLDVG